MADDHYNNDIFIRQTQNLQIGDRFLVRSDDDIPEWINAMDKYKGQWLTVAKRIGKGRESIYTDQENNYGAFYPTDIEQVSMQVPVVSTQSPNLPAV